MPKSASTIMLCSGQQLGSASYPAALEDAIRQSIREELARHTVRIGYASATAGADIIFGEELIARKGELHIILPCDREDFIAQYVAPAGRKWKARFRALCAAAASVEVSCEEKLLGDETLLRFNNQMLQGIARIHAERVGAQARLLLAWSPGAPAEPGSPADFMDQWPELEHLTLIDLDELQDRACPGADVQSADISKPDALEIGISPRAIRSILFADIATYTAYPDEQVPLLWDFLAEVHHTMDAHAKAPVLINSWGDALHAAAETALALAGYAMSLADGIRKVRPSDFGLKTRPRLRIALHAGPVFIGLHPLTGHSMIFGHHVNRAARIEPIAKPGEIYASKHFIALLRAEMDADQHASHIMGESYRAPYGLEYVGRMELPKKFGHESIYRIVQRPQRTRSSSQGKARLQPALHLTVQNDLAEIGRIAAVIEEFCAERKLSKETADAVNLALDELLTNTINYGYEDESRHVIEIMLLQDSDRLMVTLRDDARPFDPTSVPEPDTDASLDDRQIGGLGIHLARAMMDNIEYQRVGGRNQLTLTKMVET